MDREEKIREEVEKTINAPGHMAKLEASPYLFTRLKAGIENLNEGKQKVSIFQSGILKPAALLIFLLLNAFTSFYIINSNTETSTSRQKYISAISSEYNLNQTNDSQLSKFLGE